ncbi:hypothetical protein [Wenjunlia vitaminophila]|nr:hypothetical protein [Wenjunlia vitaminophila]
MIAEKTLWAGGMALTATGLPSGSSPRTSAAGSENPRREEGLPLPR